MRTGCLILAAGRSSRMGGPNKLLANLGGKPVLTHVFDAVRAAALPALVVTGRDRAEIEALSPFPTVYAEDYAEGLAHSLRAGLAAVDWDAAIICLGDMPSISPATLRTLATRATPSALIVPTLEGQRGNPVLWGRAYFPALMTLKGDTGGRTLFETRDITELTVDDPAIHADIDTPADLVAHTHRHPGESRDPAQAPVPDPGFRRDDGA